MIMAKKAVMVMEKIAAHEEILVKEVGVVVEEGVL